MILYTRRRFRREITEARRTYREAAEEAVARAAARERELDATLDKLVSARLDRDYITVRWGPRLTVVIEVDDLLTRASLGDADYRRLAERIVMRLAGLTRDHRPDLRAPERLPLANP